MTEVYEVATFYHHFDVVDGDETPPPPITVRVCETLSCKMAGADGAARRAARARRRERARARRAVHRPLRAGAGRGRRPQSDRPRDAAAHPRGDRRRAVEATPPPYIDLAAYRRDGGYRTLVDCIDGRRSVDAVIAEMENSSLRGLGGAGFPAGRKWKIVRAEPAPRLMAVNIDEGEPGTFKDRYYLERDPHRFLEGMLIAAWAVGIDEIYIYLRDEYAACRAILDARARGACAGPAMRAAARSTCAAAQVRTSAAKNPR